MSEHRSLISSYLLQHARGLGVLAVLALAATACGSSETSTGGGGASGGSGGSGAGQTTGQGAGGGQATTIGEGGGQTTTGEGGGTGGGGGMPQPKASSCYYQCSSVNDCFSAGSLPPFDGDNYACESSFCIYKGCNNNQECTEVYGENVSCKAYPGSTVKSCLLDCSSAADCYSAGSLPPFDGDNYACENGVCIYKGCNNTQECIDAYGEAAKISCKAYPGSTTKNCLLDCSSVSDCIGPDPQAHVDADNYACEDTVCVYKGCNSTTECVDALGSDYICSEGP